MKGQKKTELFPFIMPWKSLPLEKTKLLKFLFQCIASSKGEKGIDLFQSEEHLPKRIDNKETSLLNVLLGMGKTVMRNADESKPSIREILKTELSLISYLKEEQKLNEEFFKAVANAFRIKLIIYKLEGNDIDITDYIPNEEVKTNLKPRSINVMIMDKSLLFVYSWKQKVKTEMFLEDYNAIMTSKCNELKILIGKLKMKSKPDQS